MVVAGGMENMTQAPFVIRGLRNGLKLGGGALEDSLMAGLTDTYCGLPMALTAEKLAEQYGITRKDADAYALRSQQAADAAYKACRIKQELVPVEVKRGKKTLVVSEDDHRRPDTTMEILEKLPPSFKKDGIVTAGNASGIVDGAAAVVVTGEKTAKERGLKPLGRIVSWAAAGVDPSIMGIGPVPSSRKALKLAGLTLEQMDRVEVNEAFAAQNRFLINFPFPDEVLIRGLSEEKHGNSKSGSRGVWADGFRYRTSMCGGGLPHGRPRSERGAGG